MNHDDAEAFAEEADRLSAEIWPLVAPLLRGRGSATQSAVLADLTSRWLAGNPPEARDELLGLFVRLVRVLTLENERQMFGEAGHPGKLS
jgi:hypothetical protein